jgi:hypothetical protein
MSMSQYVDSFFFVSLGITFILLFLMAFHFKGRISAMEKKNRTLTDICTTIVSEIGSLKQNMQTLSTQPQPPPIQAPPTIDTLYYAVPNDEDDEDVEDDDSSDDDVEMEETEIVVDDNSETEIIVQKQQYSDSDLHSHSHSHSHSIQMFDLGTGLDATNIHIGDAILETLLTGHIEQSMGESKMIFVDSTDRENENENDQENRVEELADIDVNVQIIKTDEDDELINVVETQEQSEITEPKTVQDDYKKMNVHMLRTAAIRDGLCEDPSKMKKQDLLKLFTRTESNL